MMIEVMDGVADFCIADISITSPRAKAFTFSMPWLVRQNPPSFTKGRVTLPKQMSFQKSSVGGLIFNPIFLLLVLRS